MSQKTPKELLARLDSTVNTDRMVTTTRRTTSSTALRAARPSRDSVPAPKPANDHSEYAGKTSAELRALLELTRGQAKMLEAIAAGSPFAETKRAADEMNARVAELEQAIQRAEIREDRAPAPSAPGSELNPNTAAGIRYRAKKAEKKKQETAKKAELAARMREELGEPLERLGEISDYETISDPIPRTYENTEIPEKLEEIQKILARMEFGVATVDRLRKQLQAKWPKWSNTAIRNQLRKLARQHDIVTDLYTGPAPYLNTYRNVTDLQLYAMAHQDIYKATQFWRKDYDKKLAKAGVKKD